MVVAGAVVRAVDVAGGEGQFERRRLTFILKLRLTSRVRNGSRVRDRHHLCDGPYVLARAQRVHDCAAVAGATEYHIEFGDDSDAHDLAMERDELGHERG